jgi:TRAP-type C4-dicarboxylate transport system substrate-binding protein
VLVSAGLVTAALSGCGAGGGDKRQIIRIGHDQATDHPTNIALMAYEEYIEEKLGDKYNVEVYPSELLGSQTDMVQTRSC